MDCQKSTESSREIAAFFSGAANVLPFPVQPFATNARRGRKAKRKNVLSFTGVKRENYDVAATLPSWKLAMLQFVANLHLMIANNEVTGLAVVRTGGVPTDDGDPEGTVTLFGVHGVDLAYTARVMEHIQAQASALAEKSPARAIQHAAAAKALQPSDRI